MLTDTIKWIEINWKVLDTINDNRSIIGSTEDREDLDESLAHLFVKMMIANVYVLGPWA
jgi:hypothetical protein